MKNVTIVDVANKAGVSPATVTHALNGKRPVNDATRVRIIQAIKELGYVPNFNASRLRSGRSGIIGCYATDITESFANRLVRGLQCALSGNDSSLLFTSGVELGGSVSRAIKLFRSYNVDGILLCSHIMMNSSTMDELAASGIPAVSVNSEIEGIPSIIPDNYAGGMQAADHLVASGCTHPSLVTGPEKREVVTQRGKGYIERLRELNIDVSGSLIQEGDYTFSSGYEKTKLILSSHPEVDGVFCSNDYMAAGAITACGELGRRVPEDVLVLGFDNREFSAFWPTPISTFQPPLEQMGQLGMQMLLGLIQNSDSLSTAETIRMPSTLIIRKSTSRSRG